MKKHLILTLCALCCNAFATEPLREYYKLVAEAENMICNDQFAEAQKTYRKAFLYKEKPFHTDLSNALLCELKQTDTTNNQICSDYFKMLLKQGLFRDYDTSLFFIQTLKSDPRWQLLENIKNQFGTLEYNAKNEKLKEMLHKDQAVRYPCPNYDAECIEEVLKIDSLNNAELAALLADQGYLDENIVGHYFISIHLRVLLIHQISEVKFEVQNILLDAVRKGILDARIYAPLADRFYIQKHISEFSSEYRPPFISGGPYGTELLRMYGEYDESKEGKETKYQNVTAHLAINFSDSTHVNEISETNKNRDKIYLNDVIDEAVRRVYLMQKTPFASAIPVSMHIDKGAGKEAISTLKDESNWRLMYYIQGEHDFGFE